MNKKADRFFRTQNKTLIFSILGISLAVIITLLLIPYFQRLCEPDYQQEIKEWLDAFGIGGWLIILGVQILQIIIAFIPGEPVEIIAGVLYGTWGGLGLCLLGCLIASAIVFSISKRFGTPLLCKLFGKDKIENFTFIKSEKRVETVIFTLFLIPGMPKDMLTYVAGISNLKLSKFLSISTFARIPTIVSSTLIGSSMRQGSWEITILIFIVAAIIGLFGIRFSDKIVSLCQCNKQTDIG